MLNEKDLSGVLKTSITLPLQITELGWKVQDSTPETLLFYRLADTPEAIAAFRERTTSASFGWLIVNNPLPDLPANSMVIPEEKWPLLQKELCDLLYPLPDLKLIGITGTNGKTTTTDLVLQMGRILGKKGISIGTLGIRDGQKTILEFGLTSPPYIDLRKYLFQHGQKKDFCVMEVSSHALDQQRLFGLEFQAAGWLSFSQDHLDYHGSMETYFAAKLKILQQLSPTAHLYIPHSQTILLNQVSSHSTLVKPTSPLKQEDLPLFFQARFNRDNLEVALSIIHDLFGDFPPERLSDIHPPEGRFYIRPVGTSYIVVDFAHTPDALENICRALRTSFPQHRLKVLFGCGGDRDRRKRPLMGQAVEKWADIIYLTSDNPRHEDPMQIIQDVLAGLKHPNTEVIVERRAAVRKALAEIGENAVLLLAGKGHEDYILIKGVKHPYSDIAEVDAFVSGKKT